MTFMSSFKTLVGVVAACAALAPAATAADKLSEILAARSDAEKARDQYRHPEATMRFFGIEEGMTVIDALPGSWYGNIVLPLIGEKGTYVGAHYGEWYFKNRYKEEAAEKWAASQARIADSFVSGAKGWGGLETPPTVLQTYMPAVPADLVGNVDAYLMIRALHHTNKWDPAIMESVAAGAFDALKQGGIVGIVQHRAPETASDEWAKGFKGYLKQSYVIDVFTKAGFVLDAASEINANPKDQPGEDDMVWRLLPSNKDDDTAKAIGESDRMTLKFRKP